MPLSLEERWNKAVAVRRGPLYFGLRIGQDFRECLWENPGQGPGRLSAKPARQKSGFPVFDWEIYPATPWNYALKTKSVLRLCTNWRRFTHATSLEVKETLAA